MLIKACWTAHSRGPFVPNGGTGPSFRSVRENRKHVPPVRYGARWLTNYNPAPSRPEPPRHAFTCGHFGTTPSATGPTPVNDLLRTITHVL